MIIAIKEKLKNNIDLIIDLLRDIHCHNIRRQPNGKIRFGLDDEGSGTGNVLDPETLKYYTYSHDKTDGGDIIILASHQLKMDFSQTLHWLVTKLNITVTYHQKIEVNLPFGGFFEKYTKNEYRIQNIEPPRKYEEKILDDYITMNSILWKEDNILYSIQEKFGVGYDPYSKRITLPIRDETGSLCGVLGRINKRNVSLLEPKYLSLIPCDRSKILFGLYENYKDILSKNLLFIAEAEKSVLQALGMKFPYVVAVGKHDISDRQSVLLKSTAVNTIIIAFDEGVPFEDCCKQIEKIKIKNPFFNNKIGILYDFKNKYLPKGSKMSPFDLSKDKFKNYITECIVWEEDVNKYKTVSIAELFGY